MKVERIASIFNPEAVRIGIVHLGLGAFVRAHLAVYMQKLLNQGETRWGIAAANIRSNHELVDAMAAEPRSSETDSCPQCGHEVGDAWLVCAWCGRFLW